MTKLSDDRIETYGLIACESADGYSLHAPGSTDEDIADGTSPYLVSEPWAHDEHVIPQAAYDRAAERERLRAIIARDAA